MFWLTVIGLIVVVIWWGVCSSKKREARLSAVPEKARKRFLEREGFRLEQMAKQQEDEAASEAKNAIKVAQAEGRSYARVWAGTIIQADQIENWADRHDLKVLRVKTDKDDSRVQLSISGFSKDQEFD